MRCVNLGTPPRILLVVLTCLLECGAPRAFAGATETLHANALLGELRSNGSAGIRAKSYLVGTILPESGSLTGSQLQELYGLLYNGDGSHSLAWDDPAGYVGNLVAAAGSLAKMREVVDDPANTNGLTCLQVLYAVTGINLPASGTMNAAQVQSLFGLLFDQAGNRTSAYTDPGTFCRQQYRAYSLMEALAGADDDVKAAFALLHGVSIVVPACVSGSYVQKLFDVSGAGTYMTPGAFINDLRAGGALLGALREPVDDPANTNGVTGLAAVWGVSGKAFPVSGPLSSQTEFDTFYGLMFDADGKHTLAYTDPRQFCSSLFKVYDLMTSILASSDNIIEAFSNRYGIAVTTPVYSNEVYRQKLFSLCGSSSYLSAAAHISSVLRRGRTRGGIPYGYLRERGITNSVGEVSDELELLDSDRDGRNNLKEYVAGTEITNAESRLMTFVEGREPRTDRFRICVNDSSTTRVYFVQGKVHLRSPGWQEYTNAVGNGGRLELGVPVVTGIRFHRVGVRMEVLP